MKIDPKQYRHWLLLLQQFIYCTVAIFVRPLRKKPAKPLVILYGHQFSGNLRALYAEWSNANMQAIDLYVLSLDPAYAKQLDCTGVNVLRCCSIRDMMKLAQASAFITDHGLHLMTPLLRFTDILFIDVWHGIPFKGFTPDDFRLQHRYDEIWVSSPLLKRVYEEKFGFKEDIVRSLGYARTDNLFLNRAPDSRLRDLLSIPAGARIVLYAPTWQQDDKGRELFPFGENQDSFLQQLSDVCADTVRYWSFAAT